MVSTAMELLSMLMRWVHLLSSALLVGGTVFARMVVAPAIAALPEEEQVESWETMAARLRPLLLAGIAGLLVSGVYNVLTHPGHTRWYHIALGVKVLVSLHIFTAVYLATTHEANPRRMRQLTGAAISGVAVLLLASYLHWIY